MQYRDTPPQAIYRKDYTPPAYLVDAIDLVFDLVPDRTIVTATLTCRANPAALPGQPMTLCGESLELLAVLLDGTPLPADAYALTNETLTLLNPPDNFSLQIRTAINPAANTALEGLYQSRDTFTTQCEAEGFRRITYFPDRPDVMAVYTTTLIADAKRYPVLLANGNPVDAGQLPDGRHFAKWHDPFPKPCYLFALVAGNLVYAQDEFVTMSGRKVDLRLYVEAHNLDRCGHALAALKRSMRWDEENYGREYDLDLFMIYSADDFNMGAMENKGLNIFNSKYVLAKPETATDADYETIEIIIAHEYFHNWTGNRVTCRDWFQLSLKEGWTVFREQQFAAGVVGPAVQRIEEVQYLRNYQFPEDAGPMAHPVRPDSYVEINNFYTATVYEKGAEVIRMLRTLIGADAYRAGSDLFFARHDGQAVTCEDFVKAMEDASGRDLSQFRRWYSQAGTPVVRAEGSYDPATRSYTLSLAQECPSTPGQPEKAPFRIPVVVSLLGPDGSAHPLRIEGESAGAASAERVLDFSQASQVFRFEDLPAAPIPSLLRGFSAPVRLDFAYSDEELAFLARHDSDPFNRWEAVQKLAMRAVQNLLPLAAAGSELTLPDTYSALIGDLLASTLNGAGADPALIAEAIEVPGFAYIADQEAVIRVEAIHRTREYLRRELAQRHRAALEQVYQRYVTTGPYRPEPADIGRRSLANTCLNYLATLDDAPARQLSLAQFERANNMTDRFEALSALNRTTGSERETAMAEFARRYADDPLVMDKWLALEATRDHLETLERVRTLLAAPSFDRKNPNRVRSLVSSFAANNWPHFHVASGAGYRFLADQVIAFDPQNPSLASRLISAFSRWRRFDPSRQALMRAELERIRAVSGLSSNIFELVEKYLTN